MLSRFSLQLQSHRWLVLTGLICTAAYLYLAFRSSAYAEAQLFDLWSVSLLCALLTFALWGHYRQQQKQIPVTLLIGFAVLFRLVGITAFPVLEDDFYRYLWDGYQWFEKGSPYASAPAEAFASTNLSPTFEQILDNINHPEIATIYGPVCQWIFGLSYWIAPAKVWPLQLMFAIADLALICLLLRFTSSNNVLLYAWSPLIIKEFAFTAHPDVVGVFFLIAALLAVQKRYIYRAATLLALSAGIKVFALIAMPFILRLHWRSWLVFALTAAALALPFGLQAAWFPEGLAAMSKDWLFNAPIYLTLQPFASTAAIKLILLGAYTGLWLGYLIYFIRQQNISTIHTTSVFRGDWLYGLFFLITPVLNPWYLVWLLPFAVIYPSRWAWVASVAVLLAYASGLNLSNSELALYQQPWQLLLLEFSLITAAVMADFIFKYRKQS